MLPSLEDLQEGLGSWALVLYTTAGATTAILLIQFAVLIRCQDYLLYSLLPLIHKCFTYVPMLYDIVTKTFFLL